ncbi:hypothetical protein, partial [Streptococcus mitis]|uniref:hypothetical protein n=1 Tax=Streptococcus mitis TaxID=28037 RepID=UPI002001775F
YQMMRQNIFEKQKRQTPKMTFVYILKPLIGLFSLSCLKFFPKTENLILKNAQMLSSPVLK